MEITLYSMRSCTLSQCSDVRRSGLEELGAAITTRARINACHRLGYFSSCHLLAALLATSQSSVISHFICKHIDRHSLAPAFSSDCLTVGLRPRCVARPFCDHHWSVVAISVIDRQYMALAHVTCQ